MRTKQVSLALAVVAVLSLAAPHAHSQVIGGGYVGFGGPGYGGVVGVGAPLVAPAPLVSPVAPYVAPYPSVVVTRPFYGPRAFYGAGWGYGPRFYGPRYGRVAPGDCSPGAPTDPGVRGTPAPGSSPHVAAPPSRLWTTRARGKA
jgi:hypothetical protein